MTEPACATCGSDDINRTEPLYYYRTGKNCPDAFHDEADDDWDGEP